ncbi:lipoate--protein ligase [Erysipelothrix urinaevulpis]|uniref:lipoate--protein ligase n=1 Tax=Erysipelothrix urinaevulpis TaxID=2683717 RepID=UPI00135AA200|nr:lipoate--protein ligase [Erysipelothrix urinaevulpis]
MRYLINNSTNPYFNLALDEYAMKHIDVDEDFFFLWRNEPAVIIGKNQNTAEEINQKYIDDNGVKVARRVSGGGAVYHDFGNLNFTFVINVDDPGKVNYKKYVQPIISALKEMGIEAEASGRNDILIDGLKISGNAQRMANGKLMHHGTLLYDVNIENMVQALNVDPDKITSKGVKSVRSRVTNIKEHLPNSTDIFDFWDALQYYLSNEGQDEEIILSEEDIAKIEYEAVNKFGTWDWIYGESPEFNLKNSRRFPGGKVEIMMDVDAGYIQSVRFIGDYLGLEDVAIIEERLKNVRFNRLDVDAILSTFELTTYFGKISKEELLSLMFE